jgi:hypothetical protein
MIKMEFDEKNIQEQEIKSRLQMNLKELSEELLSLKKKRNTLFIEHLENTSMVKKNMIKEQRKGKSKTFQTTIIKQASDEQYDIFMKGKFFDEQKCRRQTSIQILNPNHQDTKKKIKENNNKKNDERKNNLEHPITSVEQMSSQQTIKGKTQANKENKQ